MIFIHVMITKVNINIFWNNSLFNVFVPCPNLCMYIPHKSAKYLFFKVWGCNWCHKERKGAQIETCLVNFLFPMVDMFSLKQGANFCTISCIWDLDHSLCGT